MNKAKTVSENSRPWFVLAACFLLSVGVNGYLIAPSSITPLFIERFVITKSEAGYIVSAAILGMVIAQIPSGYLMDRYDNRWLVLITATFYVILVVIQQAAWGFSAFLAFRVLAGVFGGFVFTLCANIVGEIFPPGQVSFATGIYIASPSVSWAFAHLTGPLVGPIYGPSRVFLLHALISFIGASLFWLTTSEPIRSSDAPTLSEYFLALRNPTIILVGLSGFSSYALYVFLNTWLPTYGTEILSLPLAAAGVATAIVPVAGIVARPSGGLLSDYIGNQRRPVLIWGLLLGLIFMIIIPVVDTFILFAFLIGAAAFAIQLGTGLYYVLTRELAATGTEGTSLTVVTTIAFSGSFFAPIIGGWLIATYSWSMTFAVFASVAISGIIALIPVNEPREV